VQLALPPVPDPVDLPAVNWRVIQTPEGNMIALEPSAYEALSLGLADVLRWMREARSQILYYRRLELEGQ
jgi:hypothetical protein